MKKILIGSILVAVLLAVGGVTAWRLMPQHKAFLTDADAIREPVDAAVTRDILWQPPMRLAEAINTNVDEYEPRISEDGQTLFLVRGKAGQNADIYICHHIPNGWTEPEPLTALNSEYEDLGPEPSHDGKLLYFYSDRPDGFGGYDLWVSHKGENGWQPPINLGPQVNSGYNDYGPALTPDGKTLYFASNRPRSEDTRQPNPNAWPATLREEVFHHDYDLYTTAITDHGCAPAQALKELNTPYNDGAPAVSPFGDFLYFASDRPGGHGGYDLYRTRRLRNTLQPPVNLGSPINTPANELDPGLTMGGYALYFSSDRPLAQAKADKKPGDYNVYYTTSREVFRETETTRRSVDWAALWARIGPNLMWLLLALLLLLLFLAFLRDFKNRKLSLLMRCLLASLLLHLLLMFLFNFWKVASGVGEFFQEGGPVQVALTPSAGEGDLAAQINGPVTDFEAAAPPQPDALSRQTALPDMPTLDATAALPMERLQVQVEDRPEMAPQIVETPHPQPRPEVLPPNPDALTSFDKPLPLDVPLPAEAARVQAPEPDATVRNVPQPVAPETRLKTDVPPPATAMKPDIALPPENKGAEIAGPAGQESLAEAAPLRDAAAQPPREIAATDVPATNGHAPPLQVALPADQAAKPAAQQAPGDPQLAAPAPVVAAAPRRQSQDIAPAVPATDNLPQVQPAPTNTDFAQAALTEVPAQALVDARPMPTSQPALALEVRDIPAAARPVAAAPRLEESVGTAARPATEEPAQAPTAKLTPEPVAHARPAVAPSPNENTPTANLAGLAPDKINTPGQAPAGSVDTSTFAMAPGTAVTDAKPASTLAPVLTADIPAGPPPARPTLAPPRLEEAPVAAQPGKAVVSSPVAKLSPASVVQSHPVLPPSRGVASGRPNLAGLAPEKTGVPDAQGPSLANLSAGPRDLKRPGGGFAVPASPENLAAAAGPLAFHPRLPHEERLPAKPYIQRETEQRLPLVQRMGGSEQTEKAVSLALQWFAKHQARDGHWDGRNFDERCGECGGEANIDANVAMTGLSLLCFLGAGHTPNKAGPYQDTVQRGVNWLLKRQKPDGDLRGEETMYSHGIATIALSEAYGMTGDARLKEPVEKAVRFIIKARNERVGGWRYDPGQPGDTSVFGWQVMALKSAKLADIEVPDEIFDHARKWLELVGKRQPGAYAYQANRQPTVVMTAEGMFTQQLLGRGRDEDMMQSSAKILMRQLPNWEETLNTYYWYYATLALYQHQGDDWPRWNEALTKQLLRHQQKTGKAAGSWDPGGEWAGDAGRIYQTALCTLMLEVYYRYLPLYSLDEKPAPP